MESGERLNGSMGDVRMDRRQEERERLVRGETVVWFPQRAAGVITSCRWKLLAHLSPLFMYVCVWGGVCVCALHSCGRFVYTSECFMTFKVERMKRDKNLLPGLTVFESTCHGSYCM